jgi:hypothetical protein
VAGTVGEGRLVEQVDVSGSGPGVAFAGRRAAIAVPEAVDHVFRRIRLLWDPTVLKLGDVHATNYGGGVRFNLSPPSANLPTTYGFVEGSYRTTNLPGYSGERIFAGLLLQY